MSDQPTSFIERVTKWNQEVVAKDKEIERLTAVWKRDLAEYNRVAVDNERLRAALERIVAMPPYREKQHTDSFVDKYIKAHRIAREALQGNSDE